MLLADEQAFLAGTPLVSPLANNSCICASVFHSGDGWHPATVRARAA